MTENVAVILLILMSEFEKKTLRQNLDDLTTNNGIFWIFF